MGRQDQLARPDQTDSGANPGYPVCAVCKVSKAILEIPAR